LLRRIGTQPVAEEITLAEDESNLVKNALDNYYKKLSFLEKELESVQNRINTFWEDAEVDFEEFLEANVEKD
jgi:hypothetical protein